MIPPVMITQEEADRILAAWDAGRDEIIDRMRQRMLALAPG